MIVPPNFLVSRQDGLSYPYSALQVHGIVLVVLVTALAIVACSLRIYSRATTRTFGLDDWLICAATLLTVNQCWASNLFIHFGYLGVHSVDIPPHDKSKQWFYNWLGQVFYSPILPLVKISILVFLLRLGGKQRTGVRASIYALIIFNISQMIAVLGVIIFQCDPLHLSWSTAFFAPERVGNCIHAGSFTLSSASLNIFTDLLVLVIPYRIFLVLKINKKMRNALIGVFMLGLIVTVFSAVRLYFMYRIFYVISQDPTYSLGYILSAVESNLAIVAASIPALWPLARRWFPCMDDTLGINRPHQADIEVQSLGDGDGTTSVASPPKVKVTWTRAKSTPASSAVHSKHFESPMLAATSNCSTAVEGCSLEGSMLPSPMRSPREKHNAEEAQDYFGNFDGPRKPACDPYHEMISTKGHVSPWSHAYTEALYKEEQHIPRDSSNTTVLTMTPPSLTSTLVASPNSTFALRMPEKSRKPLVEKP